MAILTRIARGEPKERFRVLPGADRDGARLLTVEIAGLLVSSVYAPYGNPNKWEKELGNRRLAHERAIDVRVAWLRRLREHLHEKGYAGRDSLLCGDFNVKTKSDGAPKGSAYSEREQDELEPPRNCSNSVSATCTTSTAETIRMRPRGSRSASPSRTRERVAPGSIWPSPARALRNAWSAPASILRPTFEKRPVPSWWSFRILASKGAATVFGSS